MGKPIRQLVWPKPGAKMGPWGHHLTLSTNFHSPKKIQIIAFMHFSMSCTPLKIFCPHSHASPYKLFCPAPSQPYLVMSLGWSYHTCFSVLPTHFKAANKIFLTSRFLWQLLLINKVIFCNKNGTDTTRHSCSSIFAYIF